MSLAAAAPSLLRRLGGFSRASTALYASRQRTFAVDTSDESHDDFKPKSHGSGSYDEVASMIKDDISTHKVFLYMKGVPDAPNCGFSDLACKVLRAYGVEFGSRNVLADPAIREGVKKFSNWPTIPQLYVEGEFVGGADIMMSMHESGDLKTLFEPIYKAQEAEGK